MPVLSRQVGPVQPEQLQGDSTWGEAFVASAAEAWETGPSASFATWQNLQETESGVPNWISSSQSLARSFGIESVPVTPKVSPKLSPQDAAQRVDDAGLKGQIPLNKYPEGIRSETLNVLIEKNRDKQRRQTIMSEYDGWTPAISGMLAGSLIDPANVALSFIPVVGEARYAKLLTGAGGSALARAGVRSGVGVIEGAAGAALAEPLIYAGQQQWRNDYTAMDSMLNIAGGAVFGGLLHAGAGLARDQFGNPIFNSMSETGTPIPDDLTPDQSIFRRLNEDPDRLFSDYAKLKDSEGGTVLNTDVARELSPEYLADRTRSADVHEGASATVKALYVKKLADPTPAGFDNTVMFTAGGTGAGKTTGIKAMGEAFGRPEMIYDTNMNTLGSAVKKVEQALEAGRKVDILYVYRDPVEALTGGAIPRAQRQAKEFGTGRTVPLSEHAKTHAGVRDVMEALQNRYMGDDRVSITAIDNSRGKDKAAIVPLESLPRVDKDSLIERLRGALDEQRAKGLDESIYKGFAAEGRPGAEVRGAEARGSVRGEPQQERTVGRTAYQAAEIIDRRIASLSEAAKHKTSPDRIKALEKESEELRLTLAEDEGKRGRVSADPGTRLSADDIAFITERRAQIRSELEAWRSAKSYQNSLDKLQDRLAKIDSDRQLIALSEKIEPFDIFQSIRPFINDLDEATQAASLRNAIAQAVDGRPIDVTPAMLADPLLSSDPDAFRVATQRAMANASQVEGASIKASAAAEARVAEAKPADLESAKKRLAEDEELLRDKGGDPAQLDLVDDDLKLTTDAVKAATLCMMRTGG